MAARKRQAGRLYNQTELAEALGFTTRQVARWTELGMPTRGRGRAKRYSLPDCIRWYVAYKEERALPPDIRAARARRESAQAQLAELKLGRERGEVVALEVYEAEFGQAIAQLAAALKGFPSRAAPKLVNLDGVPKVRDVLGREVRRLMEQLSRASEGMSDPEEQERKLRVAG